MAQLDNDQQARGPTRAEAAATALVANGRIICSRGQVAAPDERRREHLLSSSSSCSSCSSSASSSDGGADDNDESNCAGLSRCGGGGIELIEGERGHYSGRFHREHHCSAMQVQQSAMKLSAGDGRQQQQNSNGELVPVRVDATSAVGPVGLVDRNNSKSLSGQLSRQHSDGSTIGAQLMNVLKINDDLSSSSHARLFTSTADNGDSNMLMGHPQELDARLTMSTGAATATTSGAAAAATIMNHTDTNYDHERAILSRGHATPLVVVSPVAHHQHLHQDLYLVPANAGQEHPFNSGQQYGQYPMMEPLAMVPSHSPFYSPHHHHHHHHHHNHLQHAAYSNQLLTAADGSGQQPELSYADLDEETARHQNERRQSQQQQQPTPGESLPESVIRANEHLTAGPDDQRHNVTTFYSHQQNLQQNYTDSNLTTPMSQTTSSLRHHETSTTLAALNSSFSGDVEQSHRQLGASTGSLNVALKELGSMTADGIDGDGRWKGNRGDDLNQLQQHQHQRAELSMASESEHVVVEQNARNSPSDRDEELKVCEWRDCGNTFLDMNEFVRHLEEKHVNLEPREKNRFFCLWDNCKRNNQEFNARYKLLIHMRVHSGEKPYFCQNVSCKKSFSRLENLKIHVRSHTGEKPYRCQYEHCSKSFTNSSDRIKHHKTHKDPKPYNCTHDGCTKRYTDPSSLRKHLRAHKRHSFGGSIDSSCESSTIAVVANDHQRHHSNASCSFSSTRLASSHGPQTSSSSAAASMSNELHYANQHNRDHLHHQYEPYVETIQQQQQQVCGGDLGHHQQESGYLHADYDPSQEFASVLSDLDGTTMREEITHTTSGQEVETTYYVDSSFERPYQQHETRQQHAQPVDNFETIASTETNNGPINEQYYTQQTNEYLTPQQPSATNWNRRNQQPPPQPGRMFRNQMDSLRDRHQQLSKSWCGSGYSIQHSRQQQQPMPWATNTTGRPQQQQVQQIQQHQHQPRMASSQIQSSTSPSRTRRRVEFDWAPPTTSLHNKTEANWSGSHTTMNYDQQMDSDLHYQNQQQKYEQNWSSQQSHASAATGDNQQRQINYQAHYQQQQRQPLTRRQQHAQLMRSMPATVNFNQSRGASFEGL